MSDFAVVTCKKEEPGQQAGENWFMRLTRRWRELFYTEEAVVEHEKLELFNGTVCYHIQLPYTLEELRQASLRKIGRLNDHLRQFLAENGLFHYIVPSALSEVGRLENCRTPSYYGPVLFKALLPCILDCIYRDRGILISQLDIAIIHGQDCSETLSAIRLLSGQVKFISLVTMQKEQFDPELEAIFLDSGLSVRVTGEVRNVLRNADLIINLGGIGIDGGIAKNAISAGIGPRAVILNYQPSAAGEIMCGNILINEVEVALPRGLSARLQSLLPHFTQRFLTELLIFYRLGGVSTGEGPADFVLLQRIAEVFRKAGFAIVGFAGRRNIFRPAEIKLL